MGGRTWIGNTLAWSAEHALLRGKNNIETGQIHAGCVGNGCRTYQGISMNLFRSCGRKREVWGELQKTEGAKSGSARESPAKNANLWTPKLTPHELPSQHVQTTHFSYYMKENWKETKFKWGSRCTGSKEWPHSGQLWAWWVLINLSSPSKWVRTSRKLKEYQTIQEEKLWVTCSGRDLLGHTTCIALLNRVDVYADTPVFTVWRLKERTNGSFGRPFNGKAGALTVNPLMDLPGGVYCINGECHELLMVLTSESHCSRLLSFSGLWSHWRRMWITCLWLNQLFAINHSEIRRDCAAVSTQNSRLLVVFTEDCDFCFLKTGRACLKYVRSGNKVFLSLALNVQVHICGKWFSVAKKSKFGFEACVTNILRGKCPLWCEYTKLRIFWCAFG